MKPFSTLLCGCFFLGSLAGSVQLKAEVGIPAGLSPMVIGDSLVINEINYNSSATFDPGDWVELYNPQDHALDITNWVFKDEVDAHAFVFSQGTILPAHGYIVIAFDMTAFHTLFPAVTNYVGPMGFGLAGSGELTRVYNNAGALVDTVHYDDVAPWPTEADGQGASLELLSPLLDNALGENWKASGNPPHGTPGEANIINVGLNQPAASGKLTLSISPNPMHASAILQINTSSVIDNGTLEIYNLAGQKIQQLEHIASCRIELNRNGLQPGCYFIRLINKTGNLYATGKMMVE